MRRGPLACLIALVVIASASCLEWHLRLAMVRVEMAGANQVLLHLERPFSAGLQTARRLSRKESP